MINAILKVIGRSSPKCDAPEVQWWQVHLVETDLDEVHGIDVESGILGARSWHWLRTRMVELLSCES